MIINISAAAGYKFRAELTTDQLDDIVSQAYNVIKANRQRTTPYETDDIMDAVADLDEALVSYRVINPEV